MYRLVNVMETLTMETIDEVLRVRGDICQCDRCRLDIAAICLNMLPPSYVVTSEGEVLLRINALRQQFKVDIYKAIARAAAIVAAHPHHRR